MLQRRKILGGLIAGVAGQVAGRADTTVGSHFPGFAVSDGTRLGYVPYPDGSFVYRDPRLGRELRGRAWDLLPGPPAGAELTFGPQRDPKYNELYPVRLLVVPRRSRDQAGLAQERRFVIHALTPDDAAFARRVGGVMGRLYWLAHDYLGIRPALGRFTNVWLARQGPAGGELYRDEIYLFSIQEPRAPAEWLRELAHEYAHLTFPRFGRYTDPEPWGNGYLGERLFLKWLLADNGPQPHVWEKPVDGAAYVSAQITPHRNAFLNRGPASPIAERTDETGMLHFIGQILALEEAHGPVFLREVLARFNPPRPQGLGYAITEALEQSNPPRYTISPSAAVPSLTDEARPTEGPRAFRKAAFRFFLPPGRRRVEVVGAPAGVVAAIEPTAVRLTATQGSPGAWDVEVPSPFGLWVLLQLQAPLGGTVSIPQLNIRSLS
jgi:hypothetical protein